MSILSKYSIKLVDDGACDHLKGESVPNISLPNQEGKFLKINRDDTFRVIIYCYPMTGRPDRSLPKNWNNISGARGCTSQTCSFRDAYDDFLTLNAIPIGLTTQSISDINEERIKTLPDNVRSTRNFRASCFKTHENQI